MLMKTVHWRLTPICMKWSKELEHFRTTVIENGNTKSLRDTNRNI